MQVLDEKQKMGIDLTIKALSKIYPFIKGGELYKDYMKYDVILYINLFIDYFEVAEKLNTEIMGGWVREYEKHGKSELVTSTLTGFMKKDEDDVTVDDDRVFNEGYKLSTEIKDKLNELYYFLPEEYKVPYTSALGGVSDVSLSISDYMQYK